jgi:hypothetical protein
MVIHLRKLEDAADVSSEKVANRAGSEASAARPPHNL